LKEQDAAIVSARRARKMRWICFWLTVILLIIVAIVVAVVSLSLLLPALRRS
jgi:syntaxin 1B/2/3